MLNVLCCKLFWLPTVHTRPCSLAWCTMTVSLLAITVFRTEMTSMGNTKDMKVLTCGEREAAVSPRHGPCLSTRPGGYHAGVLRAAAGRYFTR